MEDDRPISFAATRQDINRTGIELLLTDASVALTFLSIVDTTSNRETAERNMKNARKAYDSVQHLRVGHLLTDAETVTLDSRLAEVKLRLEALGEEF